MKTITAEKAQTDLSDLLEETAISHEPIHILGQATNGVLISEDDWRSIQETLYLLSIPGMRESIQEGLKTSLEECAQEFHW